MLVSATTITQVSLLCLLGLLWVYLWLTVREQDDAPSPATGFFIQAIGLGFLVVLATMLANVTEDEIGGLVAYVRTPLAVLFYYNICRFLYALPPDHAVTERETRYFGHIFRGALLAEMIFLLYRYWAFHDSGNYAPRSMWSELPLFFFVLWTSTLSIRKLMAAEIVAANDIHTSATIDRGPARMIRLVVRAVLRPKSPVGQIHRWFTATTFTLIILVGVFTFLPHSPLPLWLSILLDSSFTVGVALTVFVYLRYQLVPFSLEMRVIGAGLTLFLLLIHGLAWGISIVYLAQELPGVPYAQVMGSPQLPDFVVPAPYRETAVRLGELLKTLIWFQICGSITFVLASAIYYRRTIIDALTELLAGFDQVAQGNLAHRIPQLPWQDEFSRIALAFNSMADGLFQSNQEVLRYQTELENLVEERTWRLIEEIEQRKALEVQKGIQIERNRIAQETHDGLLQSLAGIRIRLRRGKKLSQRGPEAIETEMAELADELSHSAKELRLLINDLKLNILDQGLKTALTRIVERQQRAYHVIIHTQLAFDETTLSIPAQLTALRLVQEAVSNACKHSGTDQIWVTLTQAEAVQILSDRALGKGEDGGQERGGLTITVRDEGRGFEPSQANGGGWGLGNMRQRVEQVGGTIHFHSQPGEGTCVQIFLPEVA